MGFEAKNQNAFNSYKVEYYLYFAKPSWTILLIEDNLYRKNVFIFNYKIIKRKINTNLKSSWNI